MPSIAQPLAPGKRITPLAFIACLALQPCAVAPAAAQAAVPTEVYPSAFFAQFLPQTALDMVLHIPGFRFDPGDESKRGFSDAGGNVLVDGGRPASKSGGLSAALSAIPASRVARIDIVRGGVSSAQATNQGMIANIVLDPDGGSLTVGAAASLKGRHLGGNLSITATRALGAFDLTSKTMFDATGERSRGNRTRLAPDETLRQRESLSYETDFPEWSERLTLAGPLAGGQISANALLARARLTESFSFVDTAQMQVEHDPKRTRRWRGEVSANWTRDVGSGYALTLLALAGFVDLDAVSQSFGGASAARLQETGRFVTDSFSRETVLRAVLSRAAGALRPEMGVEISRNTLDSRSRSTSFATGVPSSAAIDQAIVSETRTDAFAALTWSPGSRWVITTGASYEVSAISAKGSATRRSRYSFFKPRFMLSYKPDAKSDIRLSARRTVGQLSLGDFAASANLAEGTVFEGNSALRPDHRTTVALEVDRRFGRRGAFNLRFFRDWRRDVLEAGILPSGAFGTVNVSIAHAWGATANIELPTDPLVRHGLLKLGYSRLASSLADPVTGERRSISSARPSEFHFSFRQDLPAVRTSWGIDYSTALWSSLWFADERRAQRHSSELDLFLESSRFLGAKLRLQASGMLGVDNRYYRTLFVQDRRGPLNGREIWDIRTPLAVTASISRSF